MAANWRSFSNPGNPCGKLKIAAFSKFSVPKYALNSNVGEVPTIYVGVVARSGKTLKETQN